MTKTVSVPESTFKYLLDLKSAAKAVLEAYRLANHLYELHTPLDILRQAMRRSDFEPKKRPVDLSEGDVINQANIEYIVERIDNFSGAYVTLYLRELKNGQFDPSGKTWLPSVAREGIGFDFEHVRTMKKVVTWVSE